MAVELDVGYVRIEPDASKFPRLLEQAIGPAGTKAGELAGDRIGAGISDRLQRLNGTLSSTLTRAGQAAGTAGGNAAGGSMTTAIQTQLRQTNGQMTRTLQQSGEAAGRFAGDAAGREMVAHTADGIRSDRRQISAAFTQAGRQAGAEGGDEAGEGMASGLTDKLKSLGGKAGPIAMALGAAASLAGVSAAGLFVKALGDGLQQQQSADLTQAKIGVDDATMAKIGQAAGAAYGNNFGESVSANLDSARAAIQSGLLDPNATAADTQKVIEQLDTVAQVMGEDVPNVARAAGQAIRTGMVANGAAAMDLFTHATQRGLNVSEDMLDTVTEYSTQFRKVGIDGETAFALINQMVKNGARDTDVAADALKEFSLKAIEGTDGSAMAYEVLGLNMDEMIDKFVQGGPVARDALGLVLTKLREMPPSWEKNMAAVGLFGTQAEDLGAALDHMNLDTAVAEFGKVGGAANAAANTIGDNAASKIETAKRSIEISSSKIGLALADAFGPSLGKVADWVTTHQPEIIGFFKGMADGAFTTLDAVAAFSAGTLRLFANIADGVGSTLGGVLDGLGVFTSALGDVLSVIPGRGDDADFLKDAGAAMSDFNDKSHEAALGARELADGIDNKVRPGLADLRASFDESAGAAVAAAEQARVFGGALTVLPDQKSVKVNAITAEAQQLVDQFGLKVEKLPDGTSRIFADTKAGQDAINEFMRINDGKTVRVYASVLDARTGRNVSPDFVGPVSPLVEGRAGGGVVFHGRGGPTDDANLVRLSNKEGLTYVTKAAATNGATIPFLEAINAGWVPPAALLHGMVPGFAAGGVAGQRAVKYAQGHDGEPYVYGGLDCSGLQSGIYNALTGASARFVTGSDFAALGFVPGFDPNGYSIGTNNGVGENGHMAGTLFGVNVESDGSNGIQYGGSADGAQGFPSVWHLPGEKFAPPWAADKPGTDKPGGDNPQTENVSPPPNIEPTTPSGPSSAQPTMADLGQRVSDAGSGFAKSNADQFVSDLGLPAGGGYLGNVASEVSKLASWRPPVEINNHITVSDDKSQIRELERRNALALMQYGGGA